MTVRRFSNIIVATDLSPASRAAYRHAVLFAQRYEGRVALLYAEEDAEAIERAQDLPEVTARHRTERKLRRQELEAAEAHFRGRDIPVEVVEMSGSAHRAILEHAEASQADLIVMAKHGARQSDPGLMGSTAERVAHNAHVPILVGFTPTPALDDVTPYGRFAVSTDYSEDSRHGIAAVAELGTTFAAKVDVLHAITVPGDVDRTWQQDYCEAQKSHLKEVLAEMGHENLEAVIGVGLRVPQAVIAAAQRCNTDLLCIPTHGKGAIRRAIFGSVADRVMKLAPLPTMIMPRRWLSD